MLNDSSGQITQSFVAVIVTTVVVFAFIGLVLAHKRKHVVSHDRATEQMIHNISSSADVHRKIWSTNKQSDHEQRE